MKLKSMVNPIFICRRCGGSMVGNLDCSAVSPVQFSIFQSYYNAVPIVSVIFKPKSADISPALRKHGLLKIDLGFVDFPKSTSFSQKHELSRAFGGQGYLLPLFKPCNLK
jgi:hypothetical protein